MTKPLDEQLICDFRPHFNTRDDQLIRALAARMGIAPGALIRLLVRQGLGVEERAWSEPMTKARDKLRQ